MRVLVVTSLTALLAGSAAAQTTVDVVTFTPPSGWQRAEQSGMVSYTTMGNAGGRPTYCQIFVYPSRPASSNAQQNFAADWAGMIARPFASNQAPQIETRQTPEGWTVFTGYLNTVQRGIPVTAILVTATGPGRSASIVVNVTAGDYVEEVRGFLASLRYGGGTTAGAPPPSPVPRPQTQLTGSLSDYVITAPSGWTSQSFADGVIYASPVFEGGERCQLGIFQMRPATGDLMADARGAFAQIFQIDPFQNNAYPYRAATLTRGTAAAGWKYLVIRKSLGRADDYSALNVRLLAAELGDRVAIVTATGKDPLVSRCFGDLVRDEWPRVFYGLGFKNWRQVASSDSLARRLAGAWVTATATAADRYVFAGNGRYASAAAARTVSRISMTELLVTTNAYFGDGSYRIAGNTITLTSDRGRTDRGHWRLESESQDGVTWKERLCLMLEGIGEVCYRRDEIE